MPHFACLPPMKPNSLHSLIKPTTPSSVYCVDHCIYCDRYEQHYSKPMPLALCPSGSYLSVSRFQSCGRWRRKKVITLRELCFCMRLHLAQSDWMASGSSCFRLRPVCVQGPSSIRQRMYMLSRRSLLRTDSMLMDVERSGATGGACACGVTM